jgi:hypothetical protein
MGLPGLHPRRSQTSPPKTAEIDDAGVVRINGNFEQECATPRLIDVEPPATIHPSNVPEAAVTQYSLSIPARYGAPAVEAGTDINLYLESVSGRRRSHRHYKAEGQTKASEQKAAHNISPYQRAFPEINSSSVELSRKGSARL